MDLQKIVDAAGPVILAFGLKIIGALAAWIAGRWLIGVVVNMHLMDIMLTDSLLTAMNIGVQLTI